mgnify:CR=1 FL=1
MNEELIVEVWHLIREYSDKKQLGIIAEKFVDVLSENGVSEQSLENSLGNDDDLDEAIKILLDIDLDDDDDYDDGGGEPRPARVQQLVHAVLGDLVAILAEA